MEKQPDIVPIQLDNQNDFDPMTHGRQLAFEIKDTDRNRTVSVYQGIEKYILLLLYKRLENGVIQWPRSSSEARNISQQELRWLLEGLSIEQPKAIKKVSPGHFY